MTYLTHGRRDGIPTRPGCLAKQDRDPGRLQTRLSSRSLELPVRSAPNEPIPGFLVRWLALFGVVLVDPVLEAELPVAFLEETDFAVDRKVGHDTTSWSHRGPTSE